MSLTDSCLPVTEKEIEALTDRLATVVARDRIRSRLIDRVSFASDGGFYHLVPRAVVQPDSEEEIRGLFALSQQLQIPLVFRTGGSSLSGQAITDGILVDLSRFWDRISVENEGLRVRVQPGITGARVNARLRKWGRKIGPDPSSIITAMMGGILSNNASGMCCGVEGNSYHTTEFIRFMLPGGQVYSTENPGDYHRFTGLETRLAPTLSSIRDQIRNNLALREKIREKYKTKNTVGYGLNAFLDYDHPLDIFARLLIGAEGTLGFISEAVLRTLPDPGFKATALLFFPGLDEACAAVPLLIAEKAMMAELMDRASLRSVASLEGMPPAMKALPEDGAALLVEFQEETEAGLLARLASFEKNSGGLSLWESAEFTRDPARQAFFWKVRKGLFPAVGAVRQSGTTVILEDLAFPVASLGPAIRGIQALFREFGYENGIIFGHARDGNIHFVITQSFNTKAEVDRYAAFIRKVVDLVVYRFRGTLKAEHGTGRNMAPFVETEWGAEALQIMKAIKQAADPHHLLNPGVILNPDPEAHLKNLKKLPAVEEEVDRCIECGYCEPMCPSRDLSASPRRRIVVRRAIESMKQDNRKHEARILEKQFGYEGLDTCAVDGLCASACPVGINTGDLVKRLRRESHSPVARLLALQAARNFGSVLAMGRAGLGLLADLDRLSGGNQLAALSRLMRRIIPGFPVWMRGTPPPPVIPRPASPREENPGKTVIYFPACITRLMGTYPGKTRNAMEAFLSVCEKTGFQVRIPAAADRLCCGQIAGSKGFDAARAHQATEWVESLWKASEQGRFPVVTDVSSCTFTLRTIRPLLDAGNQYRYDRLRILDSVEFFHDHVMPEARPRLKKSRIALHPVCALEKIGIREKWEALTRQLAEETLTAEGAGCCGMAGDRGFLFPELTASATGKEIPELNASSCEAAYSSTRTCELALSQGALIRFESIVYLLDETL
jgi:D-lactate dehydrogenase